MIATLTNVSGVTINILDTHDGGSGAVGGQRKFPLPYPFGHIGALAASATSILPMHPSDWRYKRVYWLTHEPKDELNAMVHRGQITLSFGAQTGLRDQENLAINTL